MSKDKNDFNLIKEISRGDFLNNLLVSEYEGVVRDNSFVEEHLHINTVYMVENYYEYEVGIYITNNSNKEILLKDIPISLKLNNKELKEKILSVEKEIKPCEALFLEAKFNKEEFTESFDINSCEVELGNTSLLNKYNYVQINFEGLEKLREKLAHRQIKKFIKNLPLIEEGNIALDVFASGEVEEGFFIIILIRNISNIDINIKSIPFEIYTADDLLYYKNNFISTDGGIDVSKYTGVFKSIIIPRDNIHKIEGEDLNNYKVKIR